MEALLRLAVLPPGLIIGIALAGVVLGAFLKRLGRTVLFAAFVALWGLSMPWTAAILALSLETYPAVEAADIKDSDAEAIVVLGGGAFRNNPEYQGTDQVSRLTLERLRYAARLYRATGITLAVTGGSPSGLATAEGFMMRDTLMQDFGVPVEWVESASNNTLENARLSRVAFPFTRVVLVTHAIHMTRALRAFENAGFTVVPAPLGFISRPSSAFGFADFLPEMKAFSQSHYALYEYVGGLWYRLKYSI